MFGWFRKFNAKKAHESVGIAELGVFLRDEQVRREEALSQKLQVLKQQSGEQLSSISDAMEILASASLLNENIPERARAAMQGNREEFLRRAAFTRRLEVPGHPNSWPEFFALFQESMHDFATGSLRPLAVLREFLEHEANNVAAEIAALQKGIFAFHEEYSLSGVGNFPVLRKELQGIEAQRAAYQAAADRLKTLKQEQESLIKKASELGQEAGTLEQGDSFLPVKELKKQLEDVLNQRRSLKQGFLDRFGILDTALRKYAKATMQEAGLIESYLSNPVDALITDRDLRLLRILENVKSAIEKNMLDLKDQKKDKTLATISEITPALLNLFLRTNNALKQQEESLLKAVQEHAAMKELLALRRSAKAAEEKLSLARQETEYVTKQLASLDPNLSLSGLAEQVHLFTGKKVQL